MKLRLESLDILRGFDLFLLVGLEVLFRTLSRTLNSEGFDNFMWAFTHKSWEGFSTWDLVMPLFMFMSGITIPFALSRYRNGEKKSNAYIRIARRVALLWIFGMMCQGNLLGLDPSRIYFYSNTLQAIALGYLISSMIYLHIGSIKIQVFLAVISLLTYWGLMEFVSIGSYGGGSYTPEGNLLEGIERMVLGRFRDGASVEDGVVVFSSWYHYAWILSSLNFGVTVLTGTFAGYILKSKLFSSKKWQYLVMIGAAMVAIGWIWGIWHPVIKTIWTSSMVLVSSGYCFLLMALFYYLIDHKGYKKGFQWLKVYGMNSIVAYMLAMIVNFRCIADSLFFGLKPMLGDFYPVLLAASNATIIFGILYILYRQKIFLKI